MTLSTLLSSRGMPVEGVNSSPLLVVITLLVKAGLDSNPGSMPKHLYDFVEVI